MRDYIIRRLLLVIPIMIGVTILVHLLFRVIPGSVVDLRCGFGCTPEVRAALEHQAGLDKPGLPISIVDNVPFVHLNKHSQYSDWLIDAAQLDFGRSLSEGNLPIGDQLKRRLPITIELGVMTI